VFPWDIPEPVVNNLRIERSHNIRVYPADTMPVETAYVDKFSHHPSPRMPVDEHEDFHRMPVDERGHRASGLS
jgi:hypothetical protein